MSSQNAIINDCNFVLLVRTYKIVINEVNKAKCFSVFLDGMAHITGMELVSNFAHYVSFETRKFLKDFLQFVPTSNLSHNGSVYNFIYVTINTGQFYSVKY